MSLRSLFCSLHKPFSLRTMSSTPIPQTPKYMSADQLASLLLSSPTPSTTTITTTTNPIAAKIQIIDVRDDDFPGGNIVSALNYPSREASPAGFEQLAKDLKGKGVDKVVFHCALSQVRGPKAARRYAEALGRVEPESEQEIYILEEGFTGFQKKYKGEPKLVEKFVKSLWE
ncbi:Rhodanese-like domain-containing protein [Mrakia frigida]|uniref:Rhodanese-like domain-containing protein n=1 Tax=Mrakia frigida TaxID=29902 RepID=UPI003FCC14C5